MQWYYSDANGQQVGPLTDEQFSEAVSNGTVTSDTLVWHEGLTDWQPYSAIYAASQATAPASLAGEQGACSQCGNSFAADELVEFEGQYICGSCKPAFFQKLSEGGTALAGGGTGQTANADLTAAARANLAGRWGLGVGFNLLYNVILQAMNVIPYLGGIAAGICGPAFTVGSSRFHIAIARGEEATISMMFSGFKRLGTALWASIVMVVFILLWSLLLIIPGIMASYSYMMIWYILADDPNISAMDALRRSKKIMYGNRMKMFFLSWRFFGWALLCMLTVGIGFLWLIPYINTSMAQFYEDVRGLAEE
jgi:uncharacterized membrane protein